MILVSPVPPLSPTPRLHSPLALRGVTLINDEPSNREMRLSGHVVLFHPLHHSASTLCNEGACRGKGAFR